ncbi:MAG TPA: chemotaxis protein CheW [Polyangiaceae bacterium]|nr:chemotaxis protein CheW [Polyangiaceae bacterium]
MAEGGVICVQVAGAAYGLAVADVQEVVGYRTPTRVFHAPPALAGITSLRGEVLPIIDLANLLEGPAEARPEPTEPRVVVVRERSGARRRAGLKVDALLGLREAPAAAQRDVPPAIAARLGDLVTGVVSEPEPAFALLSVAGILNATALRELSGAAIE